jgi:lipoprotein LprG
LKLLKDNPMRRLPARILLLIATACLLLAACDIAGPPPSATPTPPPTPTPTPAPTPTPTPTQISAQIAQATLSSQSLHFNVALSGKPVYTDETQTFAIVSLAGDLKRPDGVLATAKITGGGSIAEVRMVSLDGKQYITNPLTRQWLCAPAGSIFNPVVLFDPASGVEHLLQEDFENITLVGTENLAGVPNLHLRGTIAGPPLLAISANSLGLGPVQADLWADASTLRISQIVLVDPATDPANPTTWKIDFSEYDKPVDVRAPPGVSC